MNKTLQELKVEIESVKKAETEGNLEMKNFRDSKSNLRDKSYQQNQEMKERILGFQNTIKEMDTLVKENVRAKKFSGSKHPRNQGHYEKTKSKNNKNRGRRRDPRQWHRKYFQ